MNDEARDILVICAETGCRPSEVYNVPSRDICLEDEIPHFWVCNSDSDEDEARQVKSAESKRRVPLTGASLEAMKRHPQGFPRYRGTRNFSAIASKHLKNKHPQGATAKGLRHGFENRMSDAAFPDSLAAYMMGHSVKVARGRAKYGDWALEKRRFPQDLLSLSWCEWPRPKEVAAMQGKKLADRCRASGVFGRTEGTELVSEVGHRNYQPPAGFGSRGGTYGPSRVKQLSAFHMSGQRGRWSGLRGKVTGCPIWRNSACSPCGQTRVGLKIPISRPAQKRMTALM